MLAKKIRKAYFIDPKKTKELKKLLGAKTEAEAIRQVVEEAVQNIKFWKLLHKQAGQLTSKDITL